MYNNTPTPKFQVLSNENEKLIHLKFPALVKPIAEGSSKGLKNENLVKNKNLMERVSKKCLETAKSIRWETQGMKYKKIYNSVVRNRRSFNNIYRMNNS